MKRAAFGDHVTAVTAMSATIVWCALIIIVRGWALVLAAETMDGSCGSVSLVLLRRSISR